jgi:hypothetical protein
MIAACVLSKRRTQTAIKPTRERNAMENNQSYIKSLRSAAKRAYAKEYLEFLKAGEPEGKEPGRGTLSYMAAQAVRLQLHELVKK